MNIKKLMDGEFLKTELGGVVETIQMQIKCFLLTAITPAALILVTLTTWFLDVSLPGHTVEQSGPDLEMGDPGCASKRAHTD